MADGESSVMAVEEEVEIADLPRIANLSVLNRDTIKKAVAEEIFGEHNEQRLMHMAALAAKSVMKDFSADSAERAAKKIRAEEPPVFANKSIDKQFSHHQQLNDVVDDALAALKSNDKDGR